MLNSAIVSLIAFGGAAIFGLQGALSLAVQHHIVQGHDKKSACNKVARSKEAYLANIPVAYGAVIFYGLVLFELLLRIFNHEIQIFWLNSGMVLAILVTCYYAFVMFFKLRIICMGCLRIYLANLLMAASLLSYHLY